MGRHLIEVARLFGNERRHALALIVREVFAERPCWPGFLVLATDKETDQEGTREVNRNSVLNVAVEAVAHAGMDALGRFADRIGLGSSLSKAIPWNGNEARSMIAGS